MTMFWIPKRNKHGSSKTLVATHEKNDDLHAIV